MEFKELRDLLKKDRSVRRYYGNLKISDDTLEKLIELTRYCASGRNAQPLRYRMVTKEEETAALFPALAWAGYYKDWDGPAVDERPTAYLVQCLDTDFGNDCLCDDGLQLQAITLGATTLGMAGCIIKAFNAQKVKEALNLPDNMKPRYVLALGIPHEKVKLETLEPGEGFEYYRDEDDVHHVPKRPLKDLIIR